MLPILITFAVEFVIFIDEVSRLSFIQSDDKRLNK